MSRLADLPFERKLRFAMLFTSTVAMVFACGVFLALEYVGYRRSLVRTVTTLATVTADNSTAAVAFSDTERARKTLATLRAEPQVIAAALCAKDGTVIASYTAGPDISLPELPLPRKGVISSGDRVIGVQPVIEGSRWLGTLYVWASMDLMYNRMRLYGLVVLGVLAATLGFASLLSTGLRRTIAQPILELASTAGAVTAGQDYSLRARQYGADELGRLTAAFNAMLERTHAAVSALRTSEAQLRIVTDNTSVFLAHCDLNYRYKFVNRPYAERFGVDPQAVIGRTVDDVIGSEAADAIRPQMDAVLRGERVEFETELDYREIGRRWIHVVYMPERAVDGGVVGFVAIITDVTQRKQIEQDVVRARDDALAASRAKDDFLAALSHELRTPLNPVLLLASESANDPRLPPEVREDFETVRKNVELEARLIDDLLDLTAITRGKLSLERMPVDLHAILRDAIATVSSEVERKKISLILEAGAQQPRVNGDPVRLQQVFWNVLKNAVKFTPPEGRVLVETATVNEDRAVCVRIADTGIGLSQPELERIFDAFSQGEHAGEGGSHRFGGLGLGLAISRMVIELHQGSITASSEGRGHGASFLIHLPLADGEVSAPASAPAEGEGPAPVDGEEIPHADGAGHGRILLVEDHIATRTALERLLIRRRFHVTTAGSLADARACAGEDQFDLLISDVGLPDGTGYELMQELGPRYKLRGIALTGYGMEQDHRRSFEAGFSAHLTKPIRVQALDAALSEVLRT